MGGGSLCYGKFGPPSVLQKPVWPPYCWYFPWHSEGHYIMENFGCLLRVTKIYISHGNELIFVCPCVRVHTHTHKKFQLGHHLTWILLDWDKCCPADVCCLQLILYLKVQSMMVFTPLPMAEIFHDVVRVTTSWKILAAFRGWPTFYQPW